MNGNTRSRMLKVIKEFEERRRKPKQKVRKTLIKKAEIVENIKELISKYRTIGIISLERISTAHYKIIKRELERYGVVKVFKGSLFRRAAKEVGLKSLEELEPYLTGTNSFVFTNLNAYELALLLDKLSVRKYAKPGDVATEDIYVPAGPTGIPPGPMLSVFGKLRVPTQVREGVIWIAKDTRVAKAGEQISPELASLLLKLDIKPIEVKLKLKCVWDEGLVLPAERLKINIDEFKEELLSGVSVAKELATEVALPLPEVLPEAIKRAFRRAAVLSAEAGFITKDNAEPVLREVVLKAVAVAAVLTAKKPELDLGVSAVQVTPVTQPPTEEKKEEEVEEEEKKEEVSEEEIAEGISSLFG